MLIQFSVKNWRSIKTEQTISLVKAAGGELQTTNSFDSKSPATGELLRSLAIYGPNAAGKSNVLSALRTMEKIVLQSASKWQAGDVLPVTPFLLDSDTDKSPSEFEVVFVADGVRYQYGFSANSKRIIEEWLLAFPNGRPQRWFGRLWDPEKNAYSWEMGNSLIGQKQLWQDSTRENGLFLSTAVQLNSKQLTPVFDWFRRTLRMTGVTGWGERFSAKKCSELEEKKRILSFLRAADLDIFDVIVEKEKFSSKHLPDDLPEDMKAKILEDLNNQELLDIKTVHKTAQGLTVEFDLEDESDGTQKLFAFAGPWLDALKNGYVLFVDELHNSLHPKMVEFLVMLFHSNETNPHNAQLIFTTHETSALDQNIFRRDQIWFCEKGKDQSTSVYPLTDFSPRKGRENLEAAYLDGRYGALPYLRDINSALNEVKIGK